MIETSRTMTHWSRGVSAAINEILASGLKAEGRAGDTLSVWTFNEDLNTNLCPLMELPLDPRAGFDAQVIKAVQGQAGDKKVSLDNVVSEINALAQQTDFLTVILISAGEADLHGTPFDTRINQSFRKWQDEQKKARMPFVTALRIGHGKYIQCSITPAQWPLEMPPFPRELQFVPAKPAKRLAEPPGRGPKSEGPQYADLTLPAPQANNTLAAAAQKSETKVTPIAKPAQEAASKSAPLPTPPPVVKEIQKPAPVARKSAESIPANWKPFGETLADLLASEKPNKSNPSIPQPSPKPDSAQAAVKAALQPTSTTQNPVAAKSTPRPEPTDSALAGWQPLDDVMNNRHVEETLPEPPATRVDVPGRTPPIIVAVEVRPAQKSEAASEPLKAVVKDVEKSPAPIASVAVKETSAPVTFPTVEEAKKSSDSVLITASLPAPSSLGKTEPEQKREVPAASVAPKIAETAPQPPDELPAAAQAQVESISQTPAPPVKNVPAVALHNPPVRPAENVLRKNAGSFLAIVVASVSAILCFLNWFRTIARPTTEEATTVSVTSDENPQPACPQLEPTPVESAALKALLERVPASTAPKRQPAIVRMADPSPSRNTAAKLAAHGHAA
jgi:hypothetical protein